MRCPLLPRESGVAESCEYTDGKLSYSTPFGCLQHALRINSVYSHKTKDGMKEVTTYHGREAINVDYIFFSSPNNQRLNKFY